jgi:hypothetical protein
VPGAQAWLESQDSWEGPIPISLPASSSPINVEGKWQEPRVRPSERHSMGSLGIGTSLEVPHPWLMKSLCFKAVL